MAHNKGDVHVKTIKIFINACTNAGHCINVKVIVCIDVDKVFLY